jgi:F420-dependent oxidoreductase-like protein
MALLTKFGLQIPSFTYGDRGGRGSGHDGGAGAGADDGRGLFERVVSIATTAESAGFDSLWVMDHLFQIPGIGAVDEPMFEAYTLLGGLAARTTRARLGAMVTGVTYRNPALLAKEVTALDVLSGGRAVLGIGAAWFEAEHKGLGFEFPPLAERFERLEEALKICRSMFTEDAPSFEGRFYRISGAMNRPRPVQAGGPPILVGGGGERRTLRLVAEYADACNIFGDAATVAHKLEVLARHCDDVGRDPATITKTRLGTLVIGATAKEADRKLGDLAATRGLDESMLRAMVTAGDPEAVTEQVTALLAAGLDGLVFNMPDAHDLDAVALAGKTLTGAFGALVP